MKLKDKLKNNSSKATIDKVYDNIVDKLNELSLAGNKGCYFEFDYPSLNRIIVMGLLERLEADGILTLERNSLGTEHENVLIWDESAIRSTPLESLKHNEKPCSGCTMIALDQCKKCSYKLNGITEYVGLTKKLTISQSEIIVEEVHLEKVKKMLV